MRRRSTGPATRDSRERAWLLIPGQIHPRQLHDAQR
jgi:hypothetical protein